MPPAEPALNQRAEDLYVARAAVDDAAVNPLHLTFADLLRYLSDATASLTPAQWRQFREDPRMRADYDRLKRSLAVAEWGQVAAASGGDLDERTFPGGRLRIRPSGHVGQVYLLLTIELVPATPRILLIEGTNGEAVRIPLPAPDADGSILVIQDVAGNEADARAIRLLRDPTSSGLLLP